MENTPSNAHVAISNVEPIEVKGSRLHGPDFERFKTRRLGGRCAGAASTACRLTLAEHSNALAVPIRLEWIVDRRYAVVYVCLDAAFVEEDTEAVTVCISNPGAHVSHREHSALN